MAVTTMVNTVMAACCLHNICITEQDCLDDLVDNDDGNSNVPASILAPGVFVNYNRNDAALKRDRIKRYFTFL